MIKYILNIIIVILTIITIMRITSDMTGSYPVKEQAVTYDSYVDSNGVSVSLDEFHGSYLWVDYAAQWCSYCDPQTRTMKALQRKLGDRLLFLTVVTGTDKVMKAPTADTAKQWASRFELDPEMVLAKFSTDTLPYHLLYSPSGEILFQGSGLYDEHKITNIINQHLPEN